MFIHCLVPIVQSLLCLGQIVQFHATYLAVTMLNGIIGVMEPVRNVARLGALNSIYQTSHINSAKQSSLASTMSTTYCSIYLYPLICRLLQYNKGLLIFYSVLKQKNVQCINVHFLCQSILFRTTIKRVYGVF